MEYTLKRTRKLFRGMHKLVWVIEFYLVDNQFGSAIFCNKVPVQKHRWFTEVKCSCHISSRHEMHHLQEVWPLNGICIFSTNYNMSIYTLELQ